MARYPVQSPDVDSPVILFGPVPVAWRADSPAVADDWPGVLGCCHALRPGADIAAAAALAPDDADWGVDAVAC